MKNIFIIAISIAIIPCYAMKKELLKDLENKLLEAVNNQHFLVVENLLAQGLEPNKIIMLDKKHHKKSTTYLNIITKNFTETGKRTLMSEAYTPINTSTDIPEAKSSIRCLAEFCKKSVGVQIDLQDSEHNSPLLNLLKSSEGKLGEQRMYGAKLLLFNGANKDLANKNKETPASVAKKFARIARKQLDGTNDSSSWFGSSTNTAELNKRLWEDLVSLFEKKIE